MGDGTRRMNQRSECLRVDGRGWPTVIALALALALPSCTRETSPPPSASKASDAGPGGACTPSCDDRECGPNGCGGSCGSCGGGLQCQTVSGGGGVVCAKPGTCVPECQGRDCGPDGCGGSCGSCGKGEACGKTGVCTACEPVCEGATCGPDGCGGSCGPCDSGTVCGSERTCVATGAPCDTLGPAGLCNGLVLTTCKDSALTPLDCGAADLLCDWNPDASAYDCVQQACAPQCENRECGDDGCGSVCGVCEPGVACDGASGRCGAPDCGGVDEVGRCEGERLTFCQGGRRQSVDCSSQGQSCTYDPDANDGLGGYLCM